MELYNPNINYPFMSGMCYSADGLTRDSAIDLYNNTIKYLGMPELKSTEREELLNSYMHNYFYSPKSWPNKRTKI